MLLALGAGFPHLIPCKKHGKAKERGCRQNAPEGKTTAVLGLWNLVQRTGRCDGRSDLLRYRHSRFRGIGKGRYALVRLSILLIGHAGLIVIGTGHGDGYLVGSRIIVDILVIARLLRKVVDVGAGLVKGQGIKGNGAILIVLRL